MNQSLINQAAELIKTSRGVYVLTGAGMSTESGIPDFRSDSGYYAKFDPVQALNVDVMLGNPKRFYAEGYEILKDLNNREPNDGHRALADMERQGFIQGIITQNIDNLHAKAGSRTIFEVHGETRGVHCLACGVEAPFKVLAEKVDSGEIPPRCDVCGGVLRSNVVMFGDAMPDTFAQAVEAVTHSELLIVVGSSLSVSPVNFLPRYAKHLIIINKTPTPADRFSDVVIHDGAGETLCAVYRALSEGYHD
ncbi:NAD-dependent deacetylase [Peptoniphilus equinus]|uniref:protein acetyllysine N-acetyltransferase n=1 Tax=Peptoniphilus equinus TaxID=3016343 RepID=A0ABY7QS68_9FIRM|nr:Sir2 family NAD-dependent protein deacetylase [Peptoniphilus equinus]WBW49602.1 NAD-dependent deacetylase [Peptoniphilus equinus]